ncbi:MAG: DUF4383 domain-containing protein [Bacillota bacterium]
MAKTLAIVFGIVLVIVGVLGFVPNTLVGAGDTFATNLAHDLVHLVTGIILLAVAFMASGKSGLWLKILGVVYLVLAVVGFVLAPNGGILFGLNVNPADHLLHIVLGVVFLVAGFVGKGSKASVPAAPMSTPPTGGTM